MTLIACLKASTAIILASDSRGTIGDPRGLTAINDTQKKIWPIGKHGLGLAGASEMGATLLDELKGEVSGDDDIGIAKDKIVDKCMGLFDHWFRNTQPAQRPVVLMTLAGHRFADGVPEPIVYLLNSQLNFAPQLIGHMPCLSGVPQYAVYLMHRYYDPSISVEKAKALSHYLISETASQDPKVGGPVQMAIIKPEGYTELTKEEITAIGDSNSELNRQLREFFMTGVKVP